MSTFETAFRFLRRAFVQDADADADAQGGGSGSESVEEPRAALPSAEPHEGGEFQDLMEGLGAEPHAGEPTDLRHTELEELRAMLVQLRPLGDELARTERERARLAQRCEELRQELASQAEELESLRLAKEPDPSRREASLQKRLLERQGVLERERERLAQARRQRDERSQAAADRWRELRALRSRLRQLES